MQVHPTVSDPQRFAQAIELMDAANAADPNHIEVAGGRQPRELVYAQWLTEWVRRLAPQASEALLLAARSQHLCRWEIPRQSYPLDRAGYLRWRSDLKQHHARKSAALLREAGYPEALVQRVASLNLKQNFPHDPETQVLEDALCLVFLQHQFREFATRTEPEKVISALRKSWAKMSAAARAEALKLPYTEMEQKLLARALNSGTTEPSA